MNNDPLVYTVKPLMMSFFCFMWNYGELSDDAENKYIEDIFQKENDKNKKLINNDNLKKIV